MPLPHYLVTVWNPSHASDTMDERLGVLIDWARRAQAGEADYRSLYGGMVELPLCVTREDGASWLSDRDVLTDGQLWAQRESEVRGETERMAREIQDNLLGPDVWSVLEPATHTFLASAEAVFRAQRGDPAFDFSGPSNTARQWRRR